MKKKILSLTLVVCLLAIAVVGGTLAYFTDDDNAENTFTVGNVTIDLFEPAWDGINADGVKEGNGQGLIDSESVYPGEALAKDPQVKNEGENICFVRVKVENLDQFGRDNMITLRHGECELGYDTDNWVQLGDYYYFYRTGTYEGQTLTSGVLQLGETTAPVFNQIVIPTGIENDAEAQPINVTAEAVQAQGARASLAEVIAMTPAEIAAWFGTCGL